MTLQLFRKKEKERKKEKKETERKIQRLKELELKLKISYGLFRKKENVGRKKGLQIATSLQHGYAVMKTATILHAR
jgi:hypothetical protein